jgi:transcriptional regulator of acetoin/glycerol metabolism
MSESNVRFFRAKAVSPSSRAPLHAPAIDLLGQDGHVRSLRDIERDLLFRARRRNNGCFTKAAAELCIGRSTFYRRLAEIIHPTYLADDRELT